MNDRTVSKTRVQKEASAWFARLHTREIPADALEAFRRWRQRPGHREAYADVEALWRRSGDLRDDPDIEAALNDALNPPTTSSRKGSVRGPLLGAAGLATAVVAAGAYWVWSRDVLTTDVGEQRIVRLDDGSRVRLDTDTKLRIHFNAQRRHVQLESGQAFFEVATDAERPFTVQAAGTTVRAVGTKFDVRRDGDRVRAVLVEGVIEVRSLSDGQPKRWTLRPGEQISTALARPEPMAVDVQAATSWTTGRIVLDRVPLRLAIEEVNRYSHRQITLEDPQVRNLAVSGAFDSGDTDAFVTAVTSIYPLVAERGSNGDVRLVRAQVRAS